VRSIKALLLVAAVAGQLIAAAPPAVATFPGGNGRIAFIRDGNVWTMRPDGTGQRQLTTSGTARDPAWSPDGTKIAFARFSPTTGGAYDIWVMRAGGGGKTRITTHAADEMFPAWSPDGRWIAFTSDRRDMDGDRSLIYRIRSTVPYGIPVRVTRAPTPTDPPGYCDTCWEFDGALDWSPDGRWIAFTRHFNDGGSAAGYFALIMLVRPDGTGLREIGGWHDPSWGPGGRRIAVVKPTFGDDDFYDSMNVFHENPDGSGPKAVTHFAPGSYLLAGSPEWSPDRGTRIVFELSHLPSDGPQWGPALYRIRSDGSGTPVRIASNASDPSWQPLPA
jgi:TolB protein